MKVTKKCFGNRLIVNYVFSAIFLAMISGCAPIALGGAGLGALAGQIIGVNTASTVTGGAVGAIVGNELDKRPMR